MTNESRLRFTAALVGALAAAGCVASGGSGARINLADGLVTLRAPRGFQAVVAARAQESSVETVRFRSPARRRGDFNECEVTVVPLHPAPGADLTLEDLVGSLARARHATLLATAGLHDVSLQEPAAGEAFDPWVMRSSVTIDYTLKRVERFWAVPSADGGSILTQRCQTGGSDEELAAIVEATAPVVDRGA